MPSALITGVTGQDGSYLAEALLAEGWEVHGLVRRVSSDSHQRIRHLPDLKLIGGDLVDTSSLIRAVELAAPDHVYNFAAQSSVAASFSQPLYTAEVVGLGAGRLLEAVRIVRPQARIYQASSSEMFGDPEGGLGLDVLDERSPFHPCSPYGAAKVMAHHLTVNYRESHGMFTVAGILFNHESPRRGPEFVTRRIVRGVAAIKAGRTRTLTLGNLDARRDWGWAPDYIRGIRLMMAQDTPRDFVIATGTSFTVREFAEKAFAAAGLVAEDHVQVDPALVRPRDIPNLVGNAARARAALGWAPTVSFDDLVRNMVEAELRAG